MQFSTDSSGGNVTFSAYYGSSSSSSSSNSSGTIFENVTLAEFSSNYSYYANLLAQVFGSAFASSTTKELKSVATNVQRAQTQQVTGMVARRISQMLAPRPASLRPRSAGTRQKTDSGAFEVSQAGGIRGFSTGNDQNRLGVWATGSYGWMRTGQQAKSRLAAGVVGADWRRDALVAGMAVSLEQVDSKTIFNAGALDKNGVGFTPYVAYALFDDRLVLDVMGGYAFANNETSSTLLFKTTGDYASERVMAGTHATWTEILDNWSLGGKVGFLWLREKSDGYQNSLGIQQASSASRLGTLSLGGRVGYAIGAFEPYASVTYLNDVIMTKSDIGIVGTPPNDRDEVEGLVGLGWVPLDNLTASIEATHGFLRDKIRNKTVSLNFRMEF